MEETQPESDAAPQVSPVRIDDAADAQAVSTETLRLHPQLSAYQYAPLHGDSAYLERLARDMNAILRLNADTSTANTHGEADSMESRSGKSSYCYCL